MDAFYLAQLFGAFALVVTVCGHQMASPKASLVILAVASVLFGFHFMMLGQVAFIVAFLNAFRSICAVYLDAKYLKYIIAFCAVTSIVMIIPQVNSFKDALPIFAVLIISSGVLLKSNPLMFRSGYLFGEAVWMSYGLMISSYFLSLGCLFIVISILKSMIKHDLPPYLKKRALRSCEAVI